MMHSLLVTSVVSHIRTTTVTQTAVANYSCAYCNFSTSLGHIQSVFQSRNFGLQCLKVSFPAPSLSHSFQFIHYSTTLTFQCLYLLQINKTSSSKLLLNPQKALQSSQQLKSNEECTHCTFSSQRLALALRSLAPPEITPDF